MLMVLYNIMLVTLQLLLQFHTMELAYQILFLQEVGIVQELKILKVLHNIFIMDL